MLEKQRKAKRSDVQSLQGIHQVTHSDKRSTNSHEGATHSRLLTKKQLSDMARGVRELSKRLGSVRLKLKVKTVFLLTKAHDETLLAYTREMVEWLLSKDREAPYIVCVCCRLCGTG